MRRNRPVLAKAHLTGMCGSSAGCPCGWKHGVAATCCMRNCPSVAVACAWNRKSWMTRAIFQRRGIRTWCVTAGRNASWLATGGHTTPMPSWALLPPGTTSKLQPLEHGIVCTSQSIYEHWLFDIVQLRTRSRDRSFGGRGALPLLGLRVARRKVTRGCSFPRAHSEPVGRIAWGHGEVTTRVTRRLPKMPAPS